MEKKKRKKNKMKRKRNGYLPTTILLRGTPEAAISATEVLGKALQLGPLSTNNPA